MPFYAPLKHRIRADFPPKAVARTAERLKDLRAGLKEEIPAKTVRDTLLLATWNIRDFDNNKFEQGPRLPESYYYIAEILSAFDLIAVQEINEDLSPLEEVVSILGRDNWEYMVTDVTAFSLGGNRERLGYIYDKRKITFKHVAGEIVLGYTDQLPGRAATVKLPKEHTIEFTKDTEVELNDQTSVAFKKGQKITLERAAHKLQLPEGQDLVKQRQFARTPFMVSFQSGWFKFNLCTVHLYYGEKSGIGLERRIAEINGLGKYFKERAEEDRQNYILLGDFNITKPEDKTYKALTKHGFTSPQGIHKSNLKGDMYYDQIAFRVRKDHLQLGPSDPNSGVFDFSKYVFRDDELETYHDLMKNESVRDFHDKGRKKGQPRTDEEKAEYYRNKWRTWQISDHLLLWVELKVDFADEYLTSIQDKMNGR